LDIRVEGHRQAEESSAGWVTFSVVNTTLWAGDPTQKHIEFTSLCPLDMCPAGYYPSGAAPTPVGQTTDSGKFQGFRGAEGIYPDSSGWFTITSEWQSWTVMMFAEPGFKVAYTIAPTIDLPSLWADISVVEAIEPLNPNRARSWYVYAIV
jgi:hypothetical protein